MMEERIKLKTYSHLSGFKRMPSDYELVSSDLLYAQSQPVEVPTPLAQWMIRQQRECQLQDADWRAFRDPRATTYASYTELQKRKEEFTDGIFSGMEELSYDQNLKAAWKLELGTTLSALRFPCHTLQMVAAYVAQMAPTSQIVLAGLWQSADEMRRIQHFAYRLALLRVSDTEAPARGVQAWQSDPAWQGLRELCEKLLTTYAWDEAWIALCFGVKPAFDAFFTTRFGERAERHGDPLLKLLLKSQTEDHRWHREWSESLFAAAIPPERDSLRSIAAEWKLKWADATLAALRDFSKGDET